MSKHLGPNRREEADAFLATLTEWAARRADIEGIALVGSYARATARFDSDVDVVVLTINRDRYLAHEDWLLALAPGSRIVRRQTWGPVTERRLRLASGLQIEIGMARPQWAALPLDAGTRKVLSDGARVLHDPRGLLTRAIDAVRGTTRPHTAHPE